MISRRVLFALQWTLATALAVVIANLIIEILFFAVMGWALLFLLPFVGGVIGDHRSCATTGDQDSILVIASTVGWTSFVAVLTFGTHSLPAVSNLSAKLVSAIAGYAMTSMAGAALLGAALAGATTGIALASELE